MRPRASIVSLALLLSVCLGRGSDARAQTGRTAEVILKDINAVEMPDVSAVDRDDPIAVATYIGQKRRAQTKLADLVGELHKAAPDNPRLPKLMAQRWSILKEAGKGEAVKDEVAKILAESKEPKLKAEAAFHMAVRSVVGHDKVDETGKLKAIESFIKLAPNDPRGARLLYAIGSETNDPKTERALYQRIVKEYAESDSASIAEAALKRLDFVGKPFELEFNDAIKGTVVSIKRLKGKVVVIDFWATWCGPCVEGLPDLKKLYHDYHGRGVEFIGVSFDDPKEDGGLDQLKQFVTANEVPWPQYYLGTSFKSEFAKKCEVQSLPTLFVVDAEGNLHSANAGGKLETILHNLLEKSGKGPGSSTSGSE